MKRQGKEDPLTKKVEAYMRGHEDEFIVAGEVSHALELTHHQTSTTLHHLRRYNVVGVVVQDGRGHWFVLPKKDDTRSKVLDLRTPESKPRRSRKKGINDTRT